MQSPDATFWINLKKPEDMRPDGTVLNKWKEVELNDSDLAGYLVKQYTNNTSDDATSFLLEAIRRHARSSMSSHVWQ